MLIRPAIGETDPIRYRRSNPDGQFSGNILDEAMRGSLFHAETQAGLEVGSCGTHSLRRTKAALI